MKEHFEKTNQKIICETCEKRIKFHTFYFIDEEGYNLCRECGRKEIEKKGE